MLSSTRARPLAPAHANSFTLLRLLLASLVIVSHAAELAGRGRGQEVFEWLGAKMTGGEFAVEAFFVVSGYLILQSWSSRPEAGAFFWKRVLRIVPAFVAASLISTLLVGWLGGKAGYFRELFASWGIADLAARLLVLNSPNTPPVFAGSAHPMVNGSLWTITYEFRCYLLVPLLAQFGLWTRRGRFLAGWLMVVAAAGIYSVAHLRDAMSLGLLRFVPFFLAGNCAYLYRDRIGWSRTAGAIAITATILSLGSLAATRFVLPVAGSYAVLWVALSPWSPLLLFPLRTDFSYGVYLYGWPAQKLLLWYFPGIPLWLQTILTLGLSLGLGWASWNLIEKRALAFKSRLARPDAAGDAALRGRSSIQPAAV